MKLDEMLGEDGLTYLVDLADAAGRAIMAIYKDGQSQQVALKPDASPITEADLAANELIVHGLLQRWPLIPVLSEESQNTFKEGERPPLYWAVDPLDGTKEFIKGNGEFTVNIALIAEGEPKVGVIGVPAKDLMFLGALDNVSSKTSFAKKRTANSWVQIYVSNVDASVNLNRPMRVAMSRSHPSPEMSNWLTQFTQVEVQDIGSSLKFCLVAEGLVDVYPRLGPTCIWDTAAGHALVNAAGGRVQQMNQQSLRYEEPIKTLNPFFVAWGKG
jgi:3'(2'), 5'-bisphosphate nucleotidase